MEPPGAQEPITPSASPIPASNSRSFFPAPYRIADEAPPPKRRRCSSTPRQPSSSATPDDIHTEREASAMRMFDVWSQLAEKYSRRIDEDDIVNLATGEIVKDRGVLSAETPWKFGRFADLDDSVATDEDEEDDEEDVDELDAFAERRAPEQVSVHGIGWTVPPVRKMDPADAKDLEEFMEAETRRRDKCGDEDASEDVSEDDSNVDENAKVGYESEDKTDAPEAVVSVPPLPHEPEFDESDDELGNWDLVDASNIVVPVMEKTENPEIIEIVDSPSSKTSFQPRATPKSRQPRLQLHTPPQSRTPSSVLSSTDDFLTPIPLASPPSSPVHSSPIKPKLNKHVDRPASQVRTRSQSRPRSPPLSKNEDPFPRLDLTEVERGRSVHKNTPRGKSTRSSLATTSASVGKPKASTSSAILVSHASKGTGQKSKSKAKLASSSSPTQTKRRSTLPPRSSPEPRGSSEKHVTMDEPVNSKPKGKGRLMDPEQPLVDDDRWREESDDPGRLPSSPPLPIEPSGLRRSLKKETPGKPNLHSHPAFKVEQTPSPRSAELVPRSTRKRKRTSMSSDGEGADHISASIHGNIYLVYLGRGPDCNLDTQVSFRSFESPPSSPLKNEIRSLSVSANHTSQRTAPDSEPGFHSDSEPEYESHRASSHRSLLSNSMPLYYPPPPPFYPYPPYTPGTDVHPVMPLQDPRAQFIISQAMHQLSTLFTAPWSAQPFTPPRHPSAAHSASGTSPYSYPTTTPHHPHTHPYVFDSGASVGTLPPSSPPGSSPTSSPTHGHSTGRRASLVPRSRSRGRRVSFRIDGEVRAAEDEVQGDSPDLTVSRGRRKTHEERQSGSSPSAAKRKDKGKNKMEDHVSESETSDVGSQPRADTRARLVERAQTPGPPLARVESETVVPVDSSRRRSSGSNSAVPKPKGRPRKV
ncbi:hypothetical protein DFH07DRAFT_815179 [Mycena maculata]|uniref:Uncharacterized protein n=1 Tax=Mycena maculata TaxID=230809 RepID=A0AAD7NHP3_9AGAR|nr:hypothetical protein DFH07DRAFT_815179 [Mycena maculata]